MNLQENIQRIKEMMGILVESISDINSVLRSGSLGIEVETLQNILGISKDGKFGNQTKKCVKEFQKQMDIDSDGIVGPITKKKLKKLEDKKIKWETPEFCKTNKISDNKDNEKKTNKDFKQEKNSNNIILMGGLDYRSGDLDINQQVEKLKKNITGKNVIGFRYNDLSGVLNEIEKNPESYVVLFSAGCNYASKISNKIKDKNRLFIVECYATSENVKKSVGEAVSNGVPSKNVITGPNTSRGKGVVSGSTSTPSGTNHWGSLSYVGNFIK